jgi:hypothetical protein
MPIDAEKFFARIKGSAGAGLHEARRSAPADEAPAADAMRDDESALGAKLEATASKSLDKANEILEIPLDPERQHYPAELRACTALINTAMTTQARVDETRMRPQRTDRLPELLRIIGEEEARLPKRPLLADESVSPEEEAHLRRLIAQLRGTRDGEPDG